MAHAALYGPHADVEGPPTPGAEIVVPYEPRGPLPALWPPTSQNYDRALPWVPPQTRDYLRADTWSVVVPGLPFLPGLTASEHPERLLTWFLPEWSDDWKDRALREYCRRGYRHFYLSVPDRRPPDIPQLQDACRFVKRYRASNAPHPLYVHMMLGTKVSQPHDMSTDEWKRYLDPLIDALVPSRLVDEVTAGWEWNLWNIPSNRGGPSVDVPVWLGQQVHPHGVSNWMHFAPHFTAWHQDGSDRFTYWQHLGDAVDGIDYQAVFEQERHTGRFTWTIDEMQARIVDTLRHFGREGNRWKFRLFEYQAYYAFTRDQPDEDQQNLGMFLGNCTIDNVWHTDARVWGYGGGSRRPDGSFH
jgi:hypothetical protein